MKKYAKSHTFWLIFLSAFIAIAGVMLGVYLADWQENVQRELVDSQRESAQSISAIHEYMEDVCKEATTLASSLKGTEWVQKLASGSEVFEDDFDYQRRLQIARDYLFHTDVSGVVTQRFLLFPYQDVCIGKGVWTDIHSYFGLMGVPTDERQALLEFLREQSAPVSLLASYERDEVLVFIPVEDLRRPRAWLCFQVNTAQLAHRVRQMMSAGVAGLCVVHAEDGERLMELGQCVQEGSIALRRMSARYVDWTYEFYVNPESITMAYSLADANLIRRALSSLAACLVVAGVMAMLLYAPLMRLMERVGIRAERKQRGQSDYRVIEEHIVTITERYNQGRRVSLLHQLLSGFFTQDGELLRSAGLNMREDNCYQVMLCVEQAEAGLDADQRGEMRLMLERFFREKKLVCELVDTLDAELVLLMVCQDEEDARRISLRELREMLRGSYEVFAGNPALGLVGISLSYQSARERQRRMEGVAPTRYYLPLDWEMQWMDALFSGKGRIASGICAELRRENERRLACGKLQPGDYDRLLGTLVDDLNRVVTESGMRGADVLREVVELYRQGNPEEIWAGIGSLCAVLCEREEEPVKESPEAAQRIVEYINAHYGDHDLSMSMIGDVFNLSANTINKSIKHCTGLTFHAYLTQCRMEYAKKLLAGGLRIADVAGRVGYDTEYSFRRAFQRYAGVKAQEYDAGEA